MRILVLGGTGAMGSVAIRDLVETPEVSEVIIGARDLQKAKKLVTQLSGEKLSVRQIDVMDHENLVKAIKEADAVANATLYRYNLEVTKAAIEARTHLVDLGGLYHMTLKQLELNEAAKDAGITVILGFGCGPGLTNMLTRCGADKLDRVEEIHMREGEINLTPVKFKYAVSTILDELTLEPVIYQNGEFKKIKPLSGKEIFKFPDPIGEQECYFMIHSELATVPHFINKGVKIVDYKGAVQRESVQAINVLTEMGLTSVEPIKVKGITISPKEFLAICAPPPETKVRDAYCCLAEVAGEKNGEKTQYTHYITFEYYDKWEVSAVAYCTAVPFSVISQMLARGDIKLNGVLPPEAFNPEPFIAEFAKKNIIIHEVVKSSRVLYR